MSPSSSAILQVSTGELPEAWEASVSGEGRTWVLDLMFSTKGREAAP